MATTKTKRIDPPLSRYFACSRRSAGSEASRDRTSAAYLNGRDRLTHDHRAVAIYATAVISPDRDNSDRDNVVLTGFMGTGKTTVGRLLAERLGFEFVDTDHLIEADHGPIPLIFAEQGEAAFRAIESAVAVELAGRHSLVIATGGRLMLDEANAAALTATGRTFCLTAPTSVILERVLGDGTTHRPLLDGDDPAGPNRSTARRTSRRPTGASSRWRPRTARRRPSPTTSPSAWPPDTDGRFLRRGDAFSLYTHSLKRP